MLLLLFVISNLIVLSVGNPFHKYPYVFLLDVGNEELEKNNSEQIRISAPGGSIALRYPAVGNCDIIGHVRVSGIDFGTDLKANILDGGPGYNYVVIVFMGNPGAPYDAVMTVQTLPANANDYNVVENTGNVAKDNNGYKVIEDNLENKDERGNDVQENTSREETDQEQYQSNAELMQPQSSLDKFKYEENEVEDDDSDDDDGKRITDKHNNGEVYQNFDDHDYAEQLSDDIEEKAPQFGSSNIDDNPKAEPYSVNDGYVVYDDGAEQPAIGSPLGYVDNNLYGKYKALKPHLYDDVKIYPQRDQDVQIESARSDTTNAEDPVELNQMFNDEEVHNDAQKYRDSNNNYFDNDDTSAVAY